MNVNGLAENRKSLSKPLLDWLVYIIVVPLIVIFSIANDKFFTEVNISNILLSCAPYAIVTIGMIFTLLTKGVDMTVGSTVFFSGCVGAVVAEAGGPMLLICAVMIVTGTIIGVINGMIAATLKVYPLLSTLATMFIFRGFGMMIIGNKAILMPTFWAEVLSGKIWVFSATFILAVILAVAAQLILKYTRFGKYVYAVGDSEKTAMEKGIRIKAIKVGAYTISGLTCGIAAILWSNQIMSVTTIMAKGVEFNIVMAAVLGGTSLFGAKGNTFPGAIMGALIISVVTNSMSLMKVNPHLFTVVNGLFIFLVVILDTIRNRNK